MHFNDLPATDVSWFIVQADNGATGEISYCTAKADHIEYSAAEFCWSKAIAGNGVVDGVQCS